MSPPKPTTGHQKKEILLTDQLFTSVQVLHPTEGDGKTLSAPFSFSFPSTARCCGRPGTTKSAVCPLPPSTLLSTPGVKVRVSYGVTAVCRRPGSSFYHRLLHHTVTARQPITYAPPITEQLLHGSAQPRQPLSPPSSPVSMLSNPTPETDRHQLIRSTAWLPASKLGIEDSTDAGTPTAKAQTLLPGCLPPYSPAMTLEVVMPNPPVITPGQPVGLGLFLRTPHSLLDAVAETGSGLQLCSLSVRLRCQTQARIGAAMRVDETMWPIWSVRGSVPIRQEKVDIACGIGAKTNEGDDNKSGVILPPAAAAAMEGQPGFGTCFASRVYTLEVAMGVAVVSASASASAASAEKRKKTPVAPSDIQYTKTAICVMVSEPPPDYERGYE